MAIAPVTRQVKRASDFSVFEDLESDVRIYCRKFPAVFHRAKGAELYAEDGRMFIDFFGGAGTMNYGHNNEYIKSRVTGYLAGDGLMHGLDMHTVAKREFLSAFAELVLRPRDLDYKVQFCGPTGTDAVEAALKLARKATGRTGLIAFTGAYHGMSRGSLGVTGGLRARRAGGVTAQDVTFIPYEDGPHGAFDGVALLERLLDDPSSGVARPAAVIVEPMQMEGGMYPASPDWLRRLRAVTEKYGVLLILDEIQAGCGRTGTFFCFERAGIVPDVVTVSKAIGGYGLPLSMTLFRRELDAWEPGEHTGTFRGNQLAFVAATAACELWQQTQFRTDVVAAARRLERFGAEIARTHPGVAVRGLGTALGIDLGRDGGGGGPERAALVQRYAFDHGVLVELCGRHDEVVKILPPLNIDIPRLDRGLDVLRDALGTV
ncbi:diadenosine tetraphosphatase [Actinoplanes sp. SE50]|uniref:diaminobutyrate--2-oxoglutarate transaminase n=1 Tax=unclassified Actinoplanes TaxID=2626549 RepID=UPI00023ED61A|nr:MULTISPECIES: diaminobutyrate--2-oxoglutarate transaminase [unclassified Actinoplanes]AEV85030.1 diaminobutyrate-2-oxoglutarate transaminase [Actinoplanes sp. SE50/110]ATO83421.1 diadenosine tetraphosphatase [Actinoplanes sp. SE50]SLM00828.1 aspartate aminotransferase family protein [Actinoplanes sp. SE50/110]